MQRSCYRQSCKSNSTQGLQRTHRGVIVREACHRIFCLEQEQLGTFPRVLHRQEGHIHLKSATLCKPISNSLVVSGVQFSFLI